MYVSAATYTVIALITFYVLLSRDHPTPVWISAILAAMWPPVAVFMVTYTLESAIIENPPIMTV